MIDSSVTRLHRWAAVVFAALAAVMLTSPGHAQDAPDNELSAEAQAEIEAAEEAGSRARSRGPWIPNHRDATEQLNLDEQQSEQYRELLKELREDLRKSRSAEDAKFQDLRDRMIAARDAGDQQKLRELRQEARAMQSAIRDPIMEIYQGRLREMLTVEQAEQFDQLLEEKQAPRTRREAAETAGEATENGGGVQGADLKTRRQRALPPQILIANKEALGLSDAQVSQLEQIINESKELRRNEGLDREAKRAQSELLQQRVMQVLTPEQQEKAGKLRPSRGERGEGDRKPRREKKPKADKPAEEGGV